MRMRRLILFEPKQLRTQVTQEWSQMAIPLAIEPPRHSPALQTRHQHRRALGTARQAWPHGCPCAHTDFIRLRGAQKSCLQQLIPTE